MAVLGGAVPVAAILAIAGVFSGDSGSGDGSDVDEGVVWVACAGDGSVYRITP